MKGEPQEERIPNFIGNAVILLTARHPGCEVEAPPTAQEAWRNRQTVSERYFTGRGNFPRRKETTHKKSGVKI